MSDETPFERRAKRNDGLKAPPPRAGYPRTARWVAFGGVVVVALAVVLLVMR